jgi:EAL domain-containing protein (putative c-di-GMP-specific phosphodiesterase class I)
MSIMNLPKSTAVVFIISFLLSLASVNSFNHFYTTKAIKKDTQQFLFEFHDALVSSRKILTNLPDPQLFQCNKKTREQLINIAFEEPAIRSLGVFHGKESYCTNTTAQITFANFKFHELGNNFQIASATHGKDRHDLLLVRTHGDSRYFADINPFQLNHISAKRCINCLTYQVKIIGEPIVVFTGIPLDAKSYVSLTSLEQDGDMQIELTVSVTKEFFDGYRKQSWLTSVLLSFVIALVLATLWYKFLNKRQSLNRVITEALKYSEFEPFYQPIIDSRTQEVIGAEMLVRWCKRNGNIIPPSQFIPFAEDSGLITKITEQLVTKVVKDIVSMNWHNTERFISINIVPKHIENDVFYHFLTAAMTEHQIPAKNISLEITERLQIDDLKTARSQLDKFFNYGIDLKLDDAGTGYGGFSYVQELGINTLKIDKMFIDTIDSDDVKASVLDAIINFAQTSKLKTIAEGVEEQSQVSYLAKHNVYIIQGYVYARPMAKVDLLAWLKERKNKLSV